MNKSKATLLLIAPLLAAGILVGCGATEATLVPRDGGAGTGGAGGDGGMPEAEAGPDTATGGKAGHAGDAATDADADAPSCPTGQELCGTQCVNLQTDAKHCGDCDTVCGSANATSATCKAGTCEIKCQAQFGNCDGESANGCEADLQADALNCGQCTNKCQATNGKPICSAAVCKAECVKDYADCDTNPTTCEAWLNDPKSCGTCGHDCLGGGCASGKCQPYALASQLSGPAWLSIDDAFVYWAAHVPSFASMGKVSISQGKNEYLFTDNAFEFGGDIRQFSGYLYFSGTAGTGWAICRTSTSSQAVDCKSVPKPTGGFIVDLYNLYFTSSAAHGSIGKIPIGWTDPVPDFVPDTPYPSKILVSPDTLFWTSEADVNNDQYNGSVLSIPIAGGQVTTLATGLAHPGPVGIDATHVYWADRLAIKNQIQKMPLAGGAIVPLATVPGPAAMAVDTNAVYVTTDVAHAVYRVDINGAGATVLATGQNGVSDIAVDSTAIYWANRLDGKVMKLAK